MRLEEEEKPGANESHLPKAQAQEGNSSCPLSQRSWEKKAQGTEHTHGIVATHPQLDRTGLERLSYATLQFNSRRVFCCVFMVGQRRPETQVCVYSAQNHFYSDAPKVWGLAQPLQTACISTLVQHFLGLYKGFQMKL